MRVQRHLEIGLRSDEGRASPCSICDDPPETPPAIHRRRATVRTHAFETGGA
jgi:hypothetical protein